MAENKKTHKLLCIVCPEGCEIEATEIDGEFEFEKGICKRGQDYARQEIVNPCRFLTTTVRIKGSDQVMLPVRTSEAIPKEKLAEAMQQIASIETTAPIKLGEVICPNVAKTGVALVASKTIAAS